MPQEIKDATPTVLSILQLLKIPVLRIHGVEADDVIGTLAERIAAEGSYAIIVSPDRVISLQDLIKRWLTERGQSELQTMNL